MSRTPISPTLNRLSSISSSLQTLPFMGRNLFGDNADDDKKEEEPEQKYLAALEGKSPSEPALTDDEAQGYDIIASHIIAQCNSAHNCPCIKCQLDRNPHTYHMYDLSTIIGLITAHFTHPENVKWIGVFDSFRLNCMVRQFLIYFGIDFFWRVRYINHTHTTSAMMFCIPETIAHARSIDLLKESLISFMHYRMFTAWNDRLYQEMYVGLNNFSNRKTPFLARTAERVILQQQRVISFGTQNRVSLSTVTRRKFIHSALSKEIKWRNYRTSVRETNFQWVNELDCYHAVLPLFIDELYMSFILYGKKTELKQVMETFCEIVNFSIGVMMTEVTDVPPIGGLYEIDNHPVAISNIINSIANGLYSLWKVAMDRVQARLSDFFNGRQLNTASRALELIAYHLSSGFALSYTRTESIHSTPFLIFSDVVNSFIRCDTGPGGLYEYVVRTLNPPVDASGRFSIAGFNDVLRSICYSICGELHLTISRRFPDDFIPESRAAVELVYSDVLAVIAPAIRNFVFTNVRTICTQKLQHYSTSISILRDANSVRNVLANVRESGSPEFPHPPPRPPIIPPPFMLDEPIEEVKSGNQINNQVDDVKDNQMHGVQPVLVPVLVQPVSMSVPVPQRRGRGRPRSCVVPGVVVPRGRGRPRGRPRTPISLSNRPVITVARPRNITAQEREFINRTASHIARSVNNNNSGSSQ